MKIIKLLILFQNGWEGAFKTTSVSECEWFNGFSLHDYITICFQLLIVFV